MKHYNIMYLVVLADILSYSLIVVFRRYAMIFHGIKIEHAYYSDLLND